MKHPADDMLLAYVRQQHLGSEDIQEHVHSCSVCSRRCAELRAIGNTIETWTRFSAADPLYATVSNRVIRTLHAPKVTLRERVWSSISRVRVGLPIAVVFVLLCIVLLAGLGVKAVGNVAGSRSVLQPGSKLVPSHLVATPSRPTATSEPIRPTTTSVPVGPVVTVPVVPSTSSPTVTPAPQHEPAIEVNAPCTTYIDVIENQLHVCGKHFTPGSTVTIYYQSSTKNKTHTMQVSADGTFTDILYIYGCKDVPTSVYVQGSANTEKAQVTKDITFGTCQGFGKLRKPKQ